MDQHITAASRRAAPRLAVVAREAESLWNEFAGERVAIRISAAETGGAYSIIEGILGPLSGPPLHLHANEDEVIIVTEGTLRFLVAEESFDAPAGTIVVVPRGMPHTWRNLSAAPARALGVFMPGGTERMFTQFQGRQPEELAAIAERHGTIFIGPPIAA